MKLNAVWADVLLRCQVTHIVSCNRQIVADAVQVILLIKILLVDEQEVLCFLYLHFFLYLKHLVSLEIILLFV